MKNTENKSVIDNISEGILKALNDLENLRIQLSLGKLEAKEYFEDVKKNVREDITSTLNKFRSLKQNDDVVKILNALEHLQVQLALGIAETEDAFEEQKKKILNSIHQIDQALQNESLLKIEYGQAKLAIEKLRLKLDLIGLKYRLKKINAELSFDAKKTEISDKIAQFKRVLEQNELKAETKWSHFRDEIGIAFDHFRKSFH